jgi:4-hydroxyacetophenone monooxygenase
MSGLLAGIRLKEAGIPFTILEKNAGVGGTWYENTYPGCRVDVGNHFYSYSFEPERRTGPSTSRSSPSCRPTSSGDGSSRASQRRSASGRKSCRPTWDETASVWRVKTRDAEGREAELVARAVITAVGQLNRAQLPDIPGRELFEGRSFHSSSWDHAYDYRGSASP